MAVSSVTFRQFNIPATIVSIGIPKTSIDKSVSDFCKTFELPDEKTNHARFDEQKVVQIVENKENALNSVTEMLKTVNDEKNVTAGLFLINRMIDSGVKGVEKKYHIISRFNYSDSPNIQVMLAGIYRKTQVPDAFGPLMTMFMKNAKNPKTSPFDPNEEVGGAILDYLRNKNAVMNYKQFSENLSKGLYS